ncbi:putative FAD/FMN-containing dehydrogenase [Nocardia nova SH22a]|uniref:Putative FAD/FMN-containing dehydrogenase n=1 Tax=Nocardia nova SH22a TaxID=1415166 RepID=W5T9M5_9NOCA|nr:FAD-binding protein [Nocardia nova]AHH15892.1 putative FAD/FMN-containing dehydrogenase [Nocardia nova SH22a]
MTAHEPAPAEFETDFGGLHRATPTAVHRMPAAFPAALLGSGRRLTLRGSGHSCAGQTVTDGELLVTYSPDTAVREIRDLGEGLFEVPAGASWYGVERYLNKRGRAFPVLPNYLHMSVGGTLSVGGAGAGSVRWGWQGDQVERIQLVDGIGASRWCSRTEDSELFRFALGGMGTIGLIERAMVRTVEHEPRIHLHRNDHPTLRALAEHTARVAQDGDADSYWGMARYGRIGSVTGWRGPGRSCAGEDCADVIESLPSRTDPHGAREPRAGRVRMWADWVVPAEHAVPMIESVAAQFDRVPFDDPGTMLYVLVLRRPTTAVPFAFAPVVPGPVSVAVGLYATVDSDPDVTSAVREAVRDLQRRCGEWGGRPYLYGVGDFDHVQAAGLYLGDLDRLAELRAELRLEHVNAHLPLIRAAGKS